MANRNDPDVRQHETLPGLCPVPSQSLSLPSGARPVEQMVDAAIERIAHEQRLSHYDDDRERRHPPSSKATRLRWKGLDVSEEFRDYAERVARGEDLPPFEGRVLAEPNAAFPWGSLSRSEPPLLPPAAASPEQPGKGGQLALWASAAVVMGLLGWSVALKMQAVEPPGALVDIAANGAATGAAPSDALGGSLAPPVAVTSPVVTPPAVASTEAVPAVASTEAAPVEAASTAEEPATTVVALQPAAMEPTPALPEAAAPAAAPLAVSVAPPAADPVSVQPPAPAAAPAPAPASPPVAAAPKAVASPRLDPDMDFGIDELPLPSSTGGGKAQLGDTGNIGDLARVAQPASGAVRKEPGSESSAKGSLLVEKPSF